MVYFWYLSFLTHICHIWPTNQAPWASAMPWTFCSSHSTPAHFSTDGQKPFQSIPLTTAVHTPPSEWGLSQVRPWKPHLQTPENFNALLKTMIKSLFKCFILSNKGPKNLKYFNSLPKEDLHVEKIKKGGLAYSPTSCTHISQNTCWKHTVIIWIMSAF